MNDEIKNDDYKEENKLDIDEDNKIRDLEEKRLKESSDTIISCTGDEEIDNNSEDEEVYEISRFISNRLQFVDYELNSAQKVLADGVRDKLISKIKNNVKDDYIRLYGDNPNLEIKLFEMLAVNTKYYGLILDYPERKLYMAFTTRLMLSEKEVMYIAEFLGELKVNAIVEEDGIKRKEIVKASGKYKLGSKGNDIFVVNTDTNEVEDVYKIDSLDKALNNEKDLAYKYEINHGERTNIDMVWYMLMITIPIGTIAFLISVIRIIFGGR